MVHPRTSKKTVLKIIAVFEELMHIDKAIGENRYLIAGIKNSPKTTKYRHISEKLKEGLSTKKFNLSRDEARDLVIGLDLFSIIRTDNITIYWDSEVEKLYHEFKKRFSELYNETVYDNE